MESAGWPCEKKTSRGFNSTILRPSPAFARKATVSKAILFSSANGMVLSRNAAYGPRLRIPTFLQEQATCKDYKLFFRADSVAGFAWRSALDSQGLRRIGMLSSTRDGRGNGE